MNFGTHVEFPGEASITSDSLHKCSVVAVRRNMNGLEPLFNFVSRKHRTPNGVLIAKEFQICNFSHFIPPSIEWHRVRRTKRVYKKVLFRLWRYSEVVFVCTVACCIAVKSSIKAQVPMWSEFRKKTRAIQPTRKLPFGDLCLFPLEVVRTSSRWWN